MMVMKWGELSFRNTLMKAKAQQWMVIITIGMNFINAKIAELNTGLGTVRINCT
jgi:hypothetical protein